MTQPRTPSRNPKPAYPSPDEVPKAPRRRPSDGRSATTGRTALQLSVLAVVIAGIALGLVVWRTVATTDPGVAASSSCQTTVWSAAPAADRLPDQWTVQGTTFDVNRRSITFVGVDSGSGSGAPNILGTATCFPEGAADAVARAEAAARDIGQVVQAKNDLSDGGFEATDASGAILLEFRRGNIVVDLAAAGASASEIETIASAYDRALGGDGGAISTPGPSSAGSGAPASAAPSDDTTSHNAPELEKLLPTKVGTYDMSIASDLGSAVLSQGDQDSRAAAVALTAAGKKQDDLRLAQAAAYNDNGDPVLGVTAVTVAGLDAAHVRPIVLDFFGLSGSALKPVDTTLAGKTWAKYDLKDGGPVYYLRAENDVVLVLMSTDATLAEQAAAAIK